MQTRRIAVEEAFLTADIADAWTRVLAKPDVEPGFRMMGETMLGRSPGRVGCTSNCSTWVPGGLRTWTRPASTSKCCRSPRRVFKCSTPRPARRSRGMPTMS